MESDLINKFMQLVDRQIFNYFCLPEELKDSQTTCSATEMVTKLDMSKAKLQEIQDKIEQEIIIPTTFRIFKSMYSIKHVQSRFPRSKKKRIRKKWAKDPRNFRDVPVCFFDGKNIIAHPSIIAGLRNQEANIMRGIHETNKGIPQ